MALRPATRPRCLITGAKGFIGAWIVKNLVQRGDRPWVFDLDSDSHRWQALLTEAQVDSVGFIRGDVTCFEDLDRAVAEHGVTHLVHLAALQVPACAADPGLEGFKQHVTRVRAAFPDIQFTIDDIIAEGDRVVSHWTARGTHREDFLGVSGTGKPVTVTGTSTSRISRGKIVEHWSNWDALGLMQQLGVVATLEQAKAQAAGA